MNWTNSHSYYSPISATRQDDTSNAKARGIEIIRASDVKPKKLAKLWSGRFHRGKLGFIAGEPGLGKSLIAIHMAATVSIGGDWPNGEGTARLGDVIYISAEDSAADTIRPRLEAAGAILTASTSSKQLMTTLGRDHSILSLTWAAWIKSFKRFANRGS